MPPTSGCRSESSSESASENNSEHLSIAPETCKESLRLMQDPKDSMFRDTPCTGCAASGIECTFNRLQATRGPRGLRAKTLDKIERRRRGKVDVKCADRSGENGDREQQTDEITCVVDVLDVYAERLFPIWPICDAADLRNKIKENPSRDDSARLLANAVALATIAQLRLETAWQPSVDKVETSGLNQTLDLLDSLRISFFLHIYHENASPGGTKSLVYLREAITQAQILRLDRESTYASLSEADQHVSRRVLWLLFVTERGVALLHKLPIVLRPNILFPWFGGADDQAEVLPAFLKLVHLFWVFDQSGIFEILRNADTDSDIPNMASVAQSCLELLQQKLLDSVDNDDWGPVNQVQRADMFVTRQWMRAVLWRASLRFGIVIPGMNPIDIAKDFLSLVSEIPKAALESHGPTLEFKTFEIATAMDAVSGSRLMLETPNDDAIVFQMSAQPGFDTAELLANQSNISMPTYQFMEEQASQICWPPLDLGYLVRSPSPLTRMLLESMPRDVSEEDQPLPS
ncbi:Voltage-gated potassium channel subunit beta-2 [Fusarium falciforme]|nr:Voltage-gated potassium channel subunit beta-2 [Fusarium falciforme]